MQWLIFSGEILELHYEDDCIIYHIASGETHLLNKPSIQIIEHLKKFAFLTGNVPITTMKNSYFNAAESKSQTLNLLERLLELGIICKHTE